MPDRDLSCGCSVMEGTGHAVLDGKLLKLCKMHVQWMFEQVVDEREQCAKLAEQYGQSLDNEHNRALGAAKDLVSTADEIAEAIRSRPKLTLE